MAKQSRHYRYGNLEFWAEAGMICLQDERFPPSHDQAFVTVMVREFLYRIRAVNLAATKEDKYPDEREKDLTFVEQGLEVCRAAKKQGRPDDPKVIDQMIRTRRRSSVSGNGTAAMSGAVAASMAPQNADLPPIPKPRLDKPITPLY